MTAVEPFIYCSGDLGSPARLRARAAANGYLFHHPTVVGVLDDLFGEPLFVHPLAICHVVFPGRPEHTTEPHQDFYPVKGTRNNWTVWIPLGDCDAGGGISVVRGSHRLGFLDDEALATGTRRTRAPSGIGTSFTCGDVVMFHSRSEWAATVYAPMSCFMVCCVTE